MKKLILGLSLLFLITTNVQAFKSGSYECDMTSLGMGKITYILKPNGRAKAISIFGTERGNWQDDDDAAIIIKNSQILEYKGNGKYVINQLFPCKKVK